MKSWLVTILALCTCSFLHANPSPEKVETLVSKVILQNADGYFVFSDGSCWRAIGFSKRWRTLREWWNDVQLVPENYECTPNDWYAGAQIETYPKHGNLEVNEADASNRDMLKQCTHLLVNTKTGQVLFAIALTPAECIAQIFQEARKEGYDEGYHKGSSRSYRNSTEAYDQGYNTGYRLGYVEGYQAAIHGEEQPGS